MTEPYLMMTMMMMMLMTLMWWTQVGVNAGVYEILDNLEFTEFHSARGDMKSRRARWVAPRAGALPPRGQFT